jgi:hypothetical protein
MVAEVTCDVIVVVAVSVVVPVLPLEAVAPGLGMISSKQPPAAKIRHMLRVETHKPRCARVIV